MTPSQNIDRIIAELRPPNNGLGRLTTDTRCGDCPHLRDIEKINKGNHNLKGIYCFRGIPKPVTKNFGSYQRLLECREYYKVFRKDKSDIHSKPSLHTGE